MQYVTRTFEELMRAELVNAELVLDPWLPVEGLAMIAGQTGLGKTMLALAVALAIANGSVVLGWSAPKPRKVLYIDGEMALSDMKARVLQLCNGTLAWKQHAADVILMSHADQETGFPNLVESKGFRAQIEKVLLHEGAEVLILDNLSALCNSTNENDAESWTIMQDWLLHLRRSGYSVIFLHHTGKPDALTEVTKQRGTSKREDVLNTYIRLQKSGEGGFKIYFEKHRGFEPDSNPRVYMHFLNDKCTLDLVREGVDTKQANAHISKANDPSLEV